MSFAEKLVAVITPHIRFPLTADDNLSLLHLRTFLGHHDRYLIGPNQLPEGFNDFRLRKFPQKYFSSISGYSRLLTSTEFYQAFSDYKYILIYQLDSLVFSENIEQWCDKNWDYVGAPWMAAHPWVEGHDFNDADGFWWVGNGGFSLRHVGNAIKVLNSRRLCVDPEELSCRKRLPDMPYPFRRSLQFLMAFLYSKGYKNSVGYFLSNMAKSGQFHEDLFWSFHAKNFLPEFSIPLPVEAVHFSFECAPRYCLKVTGGSLPFGCHAWAKYDRSFWQPFLMS